MRIIHHIRPPGLLYQLPDAWPVRITARKAAILERAEIELEDWWKTRQRLSFEERAAEMRRKWRK